MPIYEYKCQECGSQIERRQSVSEAPLTVCEICGGKLEKQWSLSGFQLKGEGWYVTDYAGKKSVAPEKSDNGKSEKKSVGESTTKADTASNQKAESTVKQKEAVSKPAKE